MSFNIRVDGTFTGEFRKRIPVPKGNPASAPALWACKPPATPEPKTELALAFLPGLKLSAAPPHRNGRSVDEMQDQADKELPDWAKVKRALEGSQKS